MSTLTTTLLVIAAIIAAILIYAATKPSTFRYARRITIDRPAAQIFPLINDFKRWTEWSPYEHRDPALKRTYGAQTSGVGATYAWEGDKNVGAGRMEILEAPAPQKVKIRLEFFKPFVAQNIAEFTLEELDGATDVTWAMYGPNPYMSKLMGTFINLDKMIGGDFDYGLRKLKAVVEGT
jgi:hypothetical protein